MDDPELIDLMTEGGHYLMFPEDFGEHRCPNCHHEIALGDDTEWADRNQQTIKCPRCGQEIDVQ